MIAHIDPQSITEIEACSSMMAGSSPWKDLFFSYEQCLGLLTSNGVSVHCVLDEGLVVAFIATVSQSFGGEPMIEYVCVREDRRNNGLGTQLIAFFEDQLFPLADNLYMFVSDINPRALALYQRLGYVIVGELPDYNLPNQTEYQIRKSRRPRQLKYQK